MSSWQEGSLCRSPAPDAPHPSRPGPGLPGWAQPGVGNKYPCAGIGFLVVLLWHPGPDDTMLVKTIEAQGSLFQCRCLFPIWHLTGVYVADMGQYCMHSVIYIEKSTVNKVNQTVAHLCTSQWLTCFPVAAQDLRYEDMLYQGPVSLLYRRINSVLI